MTMNRLPAEWEPIEAVMIAWPHPETDWNYMLEDIRLCYADIIAAISKVTRLLIIGPEAPEEKYLPQDSSRRNITYIPCPTNDTWVRDYGPISTVDAEGNATANDFCFNGWGLKFAADKDNLATRAVMETRMLEARYANHLGFVLEGGSIESDGCGTILTTAECLMSPNRNGDLSQAEIEAYLSVTIGANRVLWLHNGALLGDDTDGHIDTLARLAPDGDVIFYVGCSNPDDPHYETLAKMKEELMELRTADGMPYNLIELPLPEPIYDPDDGTRLPATYANFLIVNDTVFLPTYDQPLQDFTAKMALQVAMPEYNIVSVDCRTLIRQHGSLHCATMQLPAIRN